MRRSLALLTLLVIAAPIAVKAQEPPPAWVDRARSGAGTLGSQLKQKLVAAMQTGGPVAAIEVCRIQAPAIAGKVSTEGMQVGRTALKVRNPGNAPDAWEARMLEDFEHRLAAGEDPAQIQAFAVRHDGQRRWGHWMKAIPTQRPCTACHGSDIRPEVAEAIDAAYPRDQARGFSVGELRGAFSVEVNLD